MPIKKTRIHVLSESRSLNIVGRKLDTSPPCQVGRTLNFRKSDINNAKIVLIQVTPCIAGIKSTEADGQKTRDTFSVSQLHMSIRDEMMPLLLQGLSDSSDCSCFSSPIRPDDYMKVRGKEGGRPHIKDHFFWIFGNGNVVVADGRVRERELLFLGTSHQDARELVGNSLRR